jgi:hypothetical protein
VPAVNFDHPLRVAADIEDEGLVRNLRVGKQSSSMSMS